VLLDQTNVMHRVLKEPTVKQERQNAAIAKRGNLPLSEPPSVSHAKLAHFRSRALALVPTVTLERKVLEVLVPAIAASLDTTLRQSLRVASSALLVDTPKLKLGLVLLVPLESLAGPQQALARSVQQELLASSSPKIKVPQAAVTVLLERSAKITQLSVRESVNRVRLERLVLRYVHLVWLEVFQTAELAAATAVRLERRA
jgi:hypothetical protein